MKILIIHGPNLNLLGLWSSKNNSNRLTLDKVNQRIRKYIRGKDIEIKILQLNFCLFSQPCEAGYRNQIHQS